MSLVIYMLKASVSMALFYLLYRYVFSKLTFFRFNRIYLICSFLLSLILPMVNVAVRGDIGVQDYSLGINWEHFSTLPVFVPEGTAEQSSVKPLFIFYLFYFSVTAIWLIYRISRLVSTWLGFRKLSYSRYDGARVVRHPEVTTPYTLFRTIFLHPGAEVDPPGEVLRHELVHAKQLHTADLLFAELVIAFLWFNPFVFLLRKQMRENHEFLADRHALSGVGGLEVYLQALSAELFRKYDPAFASQFRSSTIKKRIIMLTNNKSSNRKRWYYMLVLPAIMVILMAFQQPVQNVISQPLKVIPGSSILQEKGGVSGIPSRFPLTDSYKNRITNGYGTEFKHPFTGKITIHNAVDIGAPKGTPVYATADGEVDRAEQVNGYGKLVVIRHQDGYSTLFAHLDSYIVDAGSRVKKGDQIGTVGNTGLSTGDHLHYEVMKDGEHVNPELYY